MCAARGTGPQSGYASPPRTFSVRSGTAGSALPTTTWRARWCGGATRWSSPMSPAMPPTSGSWKGLRAFYARFGVVLEPVAPRPAADTRARAGFRPRPGRSTTGCVPASAPSTWSTSPTGAGSATARCSPSRRDSPSARPTSWSWATRRPCGRSRAIASS